jgi:branched-chain amino acid aminotransferase
VGPGPDPGRVSERDGGPGDGSDGRVYSVDGELVPAAEATVHVHDRGFALADAATVTLRAYAGTPFAWDRHADRLTATCEALGIDAPSADGLREQVTATISAGGSPDALVRVSITRGRATPAVGGAAPGGVPDVDTGADPTVVVTADPVATGDDGQTWSGPAALQTVKPRPIPTDSVPGAVTTHARLDRVRARQELVAAADEALVVDREGHVVGGAATDLLFVADDVLNAPQVDAPGVVRDVVVDLASDESLPVRTGSFVPDDVRAADEAFLVGPLWEVRPVDRVDGIAVGEGPVTRLLARLYESAIDRP